MELTITPAFDAPEIVRELFEEYTNVLIEGDPAFRDYLSIQNYDREILERSEKLPEKVRHRITNSHMEIETLCRYLRELDLSECREIYLLHLSDAMSNECRFLYRVRSCVPKGIRVAACPKYGGVE